MGCATSHLDMAGAERSVLADTVDQAEATAASFVIVGKHRCRSSRNLLSGSSSASSAAARRIDRHPATPGGSVFPNLGLGLAGALIGGGVFRIFGVLPGLDSIAISIRDVIAAIAGSLPLVIAFWLWQRFKKAE